MNLGGNLVSSREVFDVTSLLSRYEKSNILEVGMGTGRILRNIPTVPYSVGIDVDGEMVKEFRRVHRAHSALLATVHLVVADAQSLPFREGSFGAVVCIRALKYVRQPRQAISEMCTVLKQNGTLILEFSNTLAPNSFFYIAQNISQKCPKLRTFLPRTISRYLCQSGMTVMGMNGWHKLAPGLTTRMNNSFLLKIIFRLEHVLQKNTPPAFLSRSILVHAVKISRPSRG